MSPRDVEALVRAGHDAVWVGAWPRDPGDVEILRRAVVEHRVLVTLDHDFCRLVFGQRMRHVGIIWLRNISPLLYAGEILRAIERFGDDLQTGLMVVIGRRGMRSRSSIVDEDA